MNKVSRTNNDTIKKEMLAALKDTLGVVSPACEMVGISRNTHYVWMKEDEEYKLSVDDLLEFQMDFVESKLFTNINNGDISSTIFYLKTKAKKRGYFEKSNIDHTTNGKDVTGIKPIEWVKSKDAED
jgi:hypothetical protein